MLLGQTWNILPKSQGTLGSLRVGKGREQIVGGEGCGRAWHGREPDLILPLVKLCDFGKII